MSVSNNSMYHPEEALQELLLQKRILENAIDTQVILRILVDKGIVTREEVNDYRKEVRESDKYRLPMEDIERHENAFKVAQDNPQEYLKAILKAKINGEIK